jgi:uncharacterized protein YcfJ
VNAIKPVFKIGVALALASTFALPAEADDVYYENAQVLSVTPQFQRVNNPVQDCHTEYQSAPAYNSGDHSYGGAIIGGVAGGILGGQIGKGKGRAVTAAIGAATGALVGDHLDNNQNQAYTTRPVQSCSTVDNWQTVSSGYLVAYRYNGRDYSTVLPYDPGPNLRLRVSVAPDNGSYGGRVGYLEPQFIHHDEWRR